MSECDCWVILELRDHGISLFDEMKYLLYIAASKQPPKQTDSDSSHHHPTPPGSVKPTAKFEGPPLRLSPVFCPHRSDERIGGRSGSGMLLE